MWTENIGKPLCPTREEAEQYITEELTKAAPEGWVVQRYKDPMFPAAAPRMSWAVSSNETDPTRDYGVRLSASLEFVIFTYGNDGAGPADSIRQALQQARVIEAWELRRYGMPACLEYVMSNCNPNQWFLT